MKTSLILILSSFFFYSSLAAQIGVKLGINQSLVKGYGNIEEGESFNLTPGFQAGIIFKHSLSKKIDIIAELNYETRGSM